MRVYDMIVEERGQLAELLAGLSPEQLATPSLCGAWTVHEVAAHLATYLRLGQLKIYACMLAGAGDFGPGNERLARWYARRPSADLVDTLRRHAGARTTVPRSGYDPVLTDLVLHDYDVRIPLGLPRTVDEERLAVAFHHLATVPSAGFAVGGRLTALRFEAVDTGWSGGDGEPVRGSARDLVLAMSGRPAGLAGLTGDGVPLLAARLDADRTIPVGQRLRKMVRTLTRPSERRFRDTEAPQRP
ncbi:maleylpyruvate isomerase family mycothiol-dependent enzyme [Catenulispora subtropica]|uniref:Maleylpyruvate isomerase family mycothiol-dependent enzyme n=1 Tax=Catenulispora subtropica TaxID=450798 RepID=A0ABN2T257_9ACTN